MEAAVFFGLLAALGLTAGFFESDDDDPPVAEDDTASTDEDTPVTIDVLSNDTDAEGDAAPLSVTAASAANGTVVIGADDSLTYTPDEGYSGTDVIFYDIEDENGGTDDANVIVTVTAENAAPEAEDDTAATEADTPVTIDILGNDTDAEDDPVSITAASAANGTVVVGADDSLTYTPDEGFSGIDIISYDIADGNGGTDSATVTVTVTAAENEAPVAEDDTASTEADTPVTIDVLGNDTDAEGDPLTVTDASATNGTVVVGADGSLTYTPEEGFSGTDVIFYDIADGNGGTDSANAIVIVTAGNAAPEAEDDTAETAADTPVTLDVLGNDTDAEGDPLTVTAASATSGTVVIDADGSLTYTPDEGFSGTDIITYDIEDGNGGTDSATVTVTVTENEAPETGDDIAATEADTPVTIDVLGNDTDPEGDPLTVTAASATNGTVVIGADGSLTYTPDEGFSGTDVISYDVEDEDGGTDSATVTVTVTAAENEAPEAEDDTAETEADTPVTIDVLGNDTDPEGDPLTVTDASAANGTVVIGVDGSLTYTPDEGFSGTDVISYEVEDEDGGTDSATVTVTVTAAENEAPVAEDDTASTEADTPVTIDVLGNDTDAEGDPLTVTAASATNGTVVIGADGSLTYTPDEGFAGTDVIFYDIEDGNGGTDTANATVTVTAAENEAPVAEDDTAATDEDTPVIIDVLDNDTDAEGDPISVTAASAANGTVVVGADGSLTYTPNGGFAGIDIISYEIADGNGGMDSATVTVTVTAVP